MTDKPTSGQPDPLVAQAIALAEGGDLDLASKICVRILSSTQEMQPLLARHESISTLEDPGKSSVTPEIPYILGLASFESGDLDLAWRCFTWVAHAVPHQSEAPYMLTRVARARNDDFTTVGVLKSFLDHFPDNADEQLALGEIFFRYGRFKDALTHFEQAFALRPKDQSLRERIDIAAPRAQTGFDPRSLIESSARRPKLAIFISDLTRWREAKLARGLREVGWNVVLVFRQPLRYAPEDYFDACYWYETPDDALATARTWKADIYHMFTQLNYDTAELVLHDRPGPVVVDPYDRFEGVFGDVFYESLPHMAEQRDKEGAVLSLADGMCNRDLMCQIVGERQKEGAPNVFFPEFCWNDRAVKLSDKLHHQDGKLHVVFASSMVAKTQEGDYTFDSFYWLAKILNENAIHFHIYPMTDPAEREQLSQDFSQLQRDMPFFHFHEPIFGDAWLEELSQYDVGVAFSLPDEEEVPENMYTTAASKSWYASKIADYLDAGLVLLTNPGSMVAWLAKRYRFGECVDWQDVHDAEFWRSFSSRVLDGEFDLATARNNWSNSRHTARLAKFYDSMLASSQRSV